MNNVVGLDMLPSSIFETNDREEEDSEAQSSQEDGQSREERQGGEADCSSDVTMVVLPVQTAAVKVRIIIW